MKKLLERDLKKEKAQKTFSDFMTRKRPSPGEKDSARKILEQLGKISKQEMKINGEKVLSAPEEIKVGKSFRKGFKCVPGCTACCLNFSLDYIPSEFDECLDDETKEKFGERTIQVNGRKKKIYTIEDNFQEGEECMFLVNNRTDSDDGKGCELYPNPPLSCISAPQVNFIYRSDLETTYLQKRPFGRASQWTNIPQCEFEGKWDREEDLNILQRFFRWARYFEIDTALAEIIDELRRTKERRTRTVWKKQWKKLKLGKKFK